MGEATGRKLGADVGRDVRGCSRTGSSVGRGKKTNVGDGVGDPVTVSVGGTPSMHVDRGLLS